MDQNVCLDMAQKEPLGVILLGPRLLVLKKSLGSLRSYEGRVRNQKLLPLNDNCAS